MFEYSSLILGCISHMVADSSLILHIYIIIKKHYYTCGGQLIPYVQIALERAGPNIQFHMYRLH